MPTFNYAPAPESRAVVDIASSYGLFIGGEFVESAGGATFKTISPATEEVLAEITEASADDVDRAVAAARTAYSRVWSRMSGADRGKYLFRIARILQERAREFAVLETLDNGKPIKESRDVDIPCAAAHFFYHAGWADKLEYAGLTAPGSGPPRPVGVVGQIIPWNFPLLMLAWKIAPALATGNTVVLKPAETTPLTALLFAQVCQQADLPPGVVNIITGAGPTGQALVEHEGIDRRRQGHRALHRRHPHAGHPGARWQGRQHRLRRRAAGPGGRGHRQRHLLQPGAGVLRRVAAAGAGVDRRGRGGQAQAAAGHAAGR
jgi:hypothetical protein